VKNEEFEEQKAFVHWCRLVEKRFPALRLAHHVPNGGLRSKATAGKMKALGVKAGIPDIMIPVGNGLSIGLAIEFKAAKGRVKDNQAEVHRALQDAGWVVEVCRTAGEAITAASRYFLKKGAVSK